MSELLKSKCIHDEEHFVANQGFVNLTIGAPGPQTLSESRKIFREAARKRLSCDHDECDTALFQYGKEEGPIGNCELKNIDLMIKIMMLTSSVDLMPPCGPSRTPRVLSS